MTRFALENAVRIDESSFSMEASVADSFSKLDLFFDDDVGPVDSSTPEEVEARLDLFFGTSPASTAPPTPTPSCPPTPVPFPPPRMTSADKPPHPIMQHHPADRTGGLFESVTKKRRLHKENQGLTGQLSDSSLKKNQSQKTAKDKERSREKRRLDRKRNRHANQGKPYEIREATNKKHVRDSAAKETPFSTKDIPTSSTGYVGTRDDGGGVVDLKRLLEKEGFALEKWDGKTSRPLVDRESRIFMVLVGQPDDPSWEGVHTAVFEAIMESRSRCQFSKKSKRHRRGNFAALSRGISHGGGQKMPGNLCHSKVNEKELSFLYEDKNLARIAGFANGAFATWCPKLYQYYEEHLEALLDGNPSLQRNWLNSIWACSTINYGPRTVSKKHRDYVNLPFGWCAVTALGKFDPTKGGHLVLWELKLIIEFPPGSTILLPSSAITHSNTPVSKHEQRCSFTQYTAGGLFRWVGYKNQLAEDYWESLDDVGVEGERARIQARCRMGLSLYSTLDSIEQDQETRKASLRLKKSL